MSNATAEGRPGRLDRIAARVAGLSLRARVLILTLALVTAGLAVAGAVTYSSLRSFLVDRVDEQLRSAQPQALRAVIDDRFPAFGGRDRPGRAPGLGDLPQGVRAQVYDAGGRALAKGIGADRELPQEDEDGYYTADVAGRSYRFLASRDLAVSRADGRPVTFVVGVPLADVNDTLGRLVLIELIVGFGVLAAIGGAGLWLVRVGLRPLADIEQTAARIAAGDLSQRIEEAPPTTEVGRLGGALNTMLGTIESAFAERTASERRLRQFVADASHELQTPLTSVRGYAELFRRGAADRPEDLANAMRRIEEESERMGVLVDDLLLLARLDQGRPMECAPVDLAAITAELVGDARVVDPDRPIVLIADEPVVLDGDELRLKQIVANLLSNARTHTPAGTPVTVRVAREDDEAVLEVADRGPGMVPEHAARVFERFFRADASRARVSGGRGLGLSIVAAIAATHGGRITVDTAPGDGARFRVALPLSGPPQPAGENAGDAPWAGRS